MRSTRFAELNLHSDTGDNYLPFSSESQDGFECLYMLEACSATFAAELYPDQITSVLPPDRNLSEFCVVKRGSSMDGRDRTVSNRTALKKVFPGCDPVPLRTTAFPGIAEPALQGMESSVFGEDFEHRRIKGIVVSGSEQTEIYLFDHVDIHVAHNSMNSHARQFVKTAVDDARQEAAACRQTALEKERQCDILSERVDARERELTSRERELATCQRELSEERTKGRSIQAELANTRKAAMSTMPPETARIAAVFWGVPDA